ncbi:MAG TPA: 23S rRNA (adenine(2503)-C(2))-methyltransferase RlmN [Acidimicrobiales bacterium]|nr:23S rRNA (adenine(2503)-C(2))-methyltransferase RlmN [Acidimicrobiales bacterium]
MAESLYDLTRDELADLLEGEPRYRVDQVWEGLYGHLREPADITNIPKSLRRAVSDLLPPALTDVRQSVSDDGGTVKFLWSVAGGDMIETVLMHYEKRTTVCVSSQAGCAMGCGFCATGQRGFSRHLSRGEIVEQVIRAGRRAAPRRIDNVVFMGMGEPMANFDATWDAVHTLHDDMGIGARHITISTVGVVPGIDRLGRADLPVNLAISLHAANDRKRDRLVPLNRTYPLSRLAEACRRYRTHRNRRISFEWALIEGVNDTPTDAEELAAFALPLAAHVNLIPLNPTPGWPTRGSSPDVVEAFALDLRRRGVNTTVRHNRGTEIDAACGQLAARHHTIGRRRESP